MEKVSGGLGLVILIPVVGCGTGHHLSKHYPKGPYVSRLTILVVGENHLWWTV